jgi:glucosamine kinase
MTKRLRFFAGVDGGGTRCRVRLRAASGEHLAFTEGGPANIHRDPVAAIGNITRTVEQAFAQAGLTSAHYQQTAIGLGLAGIVSAHDHEPVKAALSGFAKIILVSDAEAACIGAHHGDDGGLVIAGTGSAAFARLKGKTLALGGRGFAIADDGSAARLGWTALRTALNAADGLGPSSPMTDKLMGRFDHDPTTVTRWTKTASQADYGHLAPLVFGFAAKGDPIAVALVKETAMAVLALRDALAARDIDKIALTGGMREALLPWIALDHPDAFVSPLRDAADGAILLAGGTVP